MVNSILEGAVITIFYKLNSLPFIHKMLKICACEIRSIGVKKHYGSLGL